MKKKFRGQAQVSDHALLRYLERAKGFDFTAIRDKIQKAAQAVIATGASSVVVDGLHLIVESNGVVVTALDSRQQEHRGKIRKTMVPCAGD